MWLYCCFWVVLVLQQQLWRPWRRPRGYSRPLGLPHLPCTRRWSSLLTSPLQELPHRRCCASLLQCRSRIWPHLIMAPAVEGVGAGPRISRRPRLIPAPAEEEADLRGRGWGSRQGRGTRGRCPSRLPSSPSTRCPRSARRPTAPATRRPPRRPSPIRPPPTSQWTTPPARRRKPRPSANAAPSASAAVAGTETASP